jgi:hypothetical protein
MNNCRRREEGKEGRKGRGELRRGARREGRGNGGSVAGQGEEKGRSSKREGRGGPPDGLEGSENEPLVVRERVGE